MENSYQNQISESTQIVVNKLARYVNGALMAIVIVGFGMTNSLFAPFFPLEAEKRGISVTTVGFLFGTFTLVLFIGSILASRLVTKIGLNLMVIIGVVLASLSTVSFGLLDHLPPSHFYVAMCFIVRIFEGLGASLYTIAAFSIAAIIFPNSLSTSYALLEAALGVGVMIGPSLGGVLYEAGGFSLPFYVVGAMLLCFGFISQLILSLTLPKKQLQKSPVNDGTEDRKPWYHLYQKSFEIWTLSITITVSAFVAQFPQPTIAIQLKKLGLADPLYIGLVFLGIAIAYAVSSLVFGKIADTFPRSRYLIMIFGSASLVVSYLLLGPAPMIKEAGFEPSVAQTIVFVTAVAAGVAMTVNATPAAIAAAAENAGYQKSLETSAMVAGIYNSSWYIGSFAGTPVCGALMDNIGFYWGSFTMAVISLVMTVFLIVGTALHFVKTKRQADENLQENV